MSKSIVLIYALVCYAIFFATFLYSIAFVVDLPQVPYTVDRGHASAMPAAVIINLILLGVFAVQHSGMARRGFKRWLAGWLPVAAERSTYVLLSSLVLLLLFWQWRPLPTVVWSVQAPWAWWLLWALAACGWLLVLTGTFAINHFDLFGLRQGWLHARGVDYSDLPLTEGTFYRLIRHPLMLGFIVAFWATPHMSAGHLLFAAAATGYILIAVTCFEEPDLVTQYGDAYRQYQRSVPMLCPWPRPRAPSGVKKTAAPS